MLDIFALCATILSTLDFASRALSIQITGKTKIFPIVGDPIETVVSPPAVNSWFSDQGLDAVMTPLEIPAHALPGFWNLLRGSSTFLGCSVTYPHKRAAFAAVDRRTARANRLGALNTIRRDADGSLSGEATDGLALCKAIIETGGTIAGRSACVIGAGGGAGLAIVDALCEAGIGAVMLEETDSERCRGAERLVREHWPAVRLSEFAGHASLLVNATTLGSTPNDPMPFLTEAIAQADCVCDVVGRRNTRLVRTARGLGRTVVDGRAMGRSQAQSQMPFVVASREEASLIPALEPG